MTWHHTDSCDSDMSWPSINSVGFDLIDTRHDMFRYVSCSMGWTIGWIDDPKGLLKQRPCQASSSSSQLSSHITSFILIIESNQNQIITHNASDESCHGVSQMKGFGTLLIYVCCVAAVVLFRHDMVESLFVCFFESESESWVIVMNDHGPRTMDHDSPWLLWLWLLINNRHMRHRHTGYNIDW